MMSFSKLMRRLSGRGFREWVPLLWKNGVYSVMRWRPSAVAARRRDQAFDHRWGTQTSGLINLSSLAVDRDRARLGVRYQASSEGTLIRALHALSVDPSRYTFIDYGAGKGRVVMSASSLPFHRVLGVEFSPELCLAARKNIGQFAAAGGSIRKAEIIQQDAGTFEPPVEPLVCYFYNPFEAPVMLEVIKKLEQALVAGAGDIRLIYLDPKHVDLFLKRGIWKITANDPEVALLASVRDHERRHGDIE